MFEEFKRFLIRGNVAEMGVGVVMGVAFKSVVDALVADMMTPLIAAVGGNTDFSALTFSLNGSQFMYGAFINTIISFAITAAVVFYAIVMPMNHMMSRYMVEETPEPTTRRCPFCMTDIPMKASRCGHCTSEIPAVG